MCLSSRYYLIRYVLSVGKVIAEFGDKTERWVFDRCQEVSGDSHNVLDIWARGAWKSSIKTFAGTIQDILRDPEVTIGIFSHTRNVAYAFTAQVMRELEYNERLKELFPTILYQNPSKDAEVWSRLVGATVKRSGNPKEATLEAWGLLDSHPAGRHFKVRRYDDIVSPNEISTTETMKKLVEAWELSLNLNTEDGVAEYTGTFYSEGDPYHEMLRRGAVRLRWHPAFNPEDSNIRIAVNATGDLEKVKVRPDEPETSAVRLVEEFDSPVFSKKFLQEKLPGTKTFAVQVLCDPTAAGQAYFKEEWLKYYDTEPYHERTGKNVLLLVDPAAKKPDKNNPDPDFSVYWVVALGADHNYYILDCVRDRFNLQQRIDKTFELHALWKPYEVRYEEYGFAVDVEALNLAQGYRGYRFHVVPVPKRGGGVLKVAKEDRIERLVPLFQSGRVYLPRVLKYRTMDGEVVDLLRSFVQDEYKKFAGRLSTQHDDMLDSLARIEEPECPLMWPQGMNYWRQAIQPVDPYAPTEVVRHSWAGA